MRGQRDPQATMPAFVDPGEVVPPDHPPPSIDQSPGPALARVRRHVRQDGLPLRAAGRLWKASVLIAPARRASMLLLRGADVKPGGMSS